MWPVLCVVMLARFVVTESPQTRPVVLWHGLSDSCCYAWSMGKMINLIKREIPGAFVLSIKIGESLKMDEYNSKYMPINKQVEHVCEELKSHPELQNGYNAVGFSQGAQFLRAIAQKCPNPQMYTLISMGGQHQGIYGFSLKTEEGVPAYVPILMRFVHFLLVRLKIVRWGVISRRYVPFQYWHDPTSPGEKEYRDGNNFIADLNNEKYINERYKSNLLKLENLVLVKYRRDKTVIPVDTQWFQFYKPGQAEEILPLGSSRLWIEDRIGLRTLSETGRLHFVENGGDHLKHSEEWFSINIIQKYLK